MRDLRFRVFATSHPKCTMWFSRMETSSRRYTSEVYPAGDIDVCENLDIVHFRCLVVVSAPVGMWRHMR